MKKSRKLEKELAGAVSHFWGTRIAQTNRQVTIGRIDQGARSSATGGKQLDGFVSLIRRRLIDQGILEGSIHTDTYLELPGYFRPEKKWDLAVIDGANLIAAIEFKSQIGPSFGNNFNNRSEEAIGCAQDIWTAYREGAFSASRRPWLGFVMLLEDCENSIRPVSVRQPHFPVFPEFIGASYSKRYQLLLTKLIRERLYDSACFLMSPKVEGLNGAYSFPNAALAFEPFLVSLLGSIQTYRMSIRTPKRKPKK